MTFLDLLDPPRVRQVYFCCCVEELLQFKPLELIFLETHLAK